MLATHAYMYIITYKFPIDLFFATDGTFVYSRSSVIVGGKRSPKGHTCKQEGALLDLECRLDSRSQCKPWLRLAVYVGET